MPAPVTPRRRGRSAMRRRASAAALVVGAATLATVGTTTAVPAYAAAAVVTADPPNPPTVTPGQGTVQLTVPAGVQAVEFVATAGSGGNASQGAKGGLGAVTGGRFYVSPNEQIQVVAGQAGQAGSAGGSPDGYSGGAPGAPGWSDSHGPVTAGGGGGASVILAAGAPVTVAAGGGGAGGSAQSSAVGSGAHPAGGDGGAAGATPAAGSPGTSLAGDNQGTKAGGVGGAVAGGVGIAGAAGGPASTSNGQTWGQGGGGGAGSPLGGGGGGVASTTQTYASGGGGGAAGQSLNAATIFAGSVGTALAAGDGSVGIFWVTDISLTTTPLPATVLPSSVPQPLAVQATDGSSGVFPSPSAFVTWSSTEPSDTFSSAGVVMTKVGSRTITASWTAEPAVSSSFTVFVKPGPAVGLVIGGPTPTTANPGTPTAIYVAAVDAFGNLFGDATSVATYSSNVPSDVFSTSSPNQVTMSNLGPHVITASYPGLKSSQFTITVAFSLGSTATTPVGGGTARPPSGTAGPDPRLLDTSAQMSVGQLPATGADPSAALLGIAAIGVGTAVLLLSRRRARPDRRVSDRPARGGVTHVSKVGMRGSAGSAAGVFGELDTGTILPAVDDR